MINLNDKEILNYSDTIPQRKKKTFNEMQMKGESTRKDDDDTTEIPSGILETIENLANHRVSKKYSLKKSGRILTDSTVRTGCRVKVSKN